MLDIDVGGELRIVGRNLDSLSSIDSLPSSANSNDRGRGELLGDRAQLEHHLGLQLDAQLQIRHPGSSAKQHLAATGDDRRRSRAVCGVGLVEVRLVVVGAVAAACCSVPGVSPKVSAARPSVSTTGNSTAGNTMKRGLEFILGPPADYYAASAPMFPRFAGGSRGSVQMTRLVRLRQGRHSGGVRWQVELQAHQRLP